MTGMHNRSPEHPAVAVVLPVYNGERWVADAVESVVAQFGWDLRIVAVDDASTDGSPALLKRLSQQFDCLTVVAQAHNRGVAAARNRAVSLSAAPLLAFIDQDDTWTADRLDRGWAALTADPGLDFVLAHQQFRPPALPIPAWFRPRWLDGPQSGHVFGTFLGWRERTWPVVGNLDEDLRMGDDNDWFIRAKDLGVRSIMVDDVVLWRGIHDANSSANTQRSREEMLRLLRRRHNRRGEPGSGGGAR